MELYERLCKNCGGDLRQTEDGRYKCSFCGSIFEEQKVKDYAEEMHRLFDEFKLDAISNARKNLYEAVNAEYISSQLVHECCMELKKLIPDDPQACFYEIATGKNVKQITKAIRKLKVDGDADIESIIRFLIRSLQTEFQLELNNLIARAFENTDPVKFEHYCTLLSAEAIKVDTGVYETKLPREVFVAYSSKDMDAVSELVETLEAQGLKCFVAARNLRHGKGAVENYNAALEEAMDHCRSVVFVSSINSRSFNCDALTIELPYLQKKDLENAPAELRNNYKAIPGQYKKPRVEYRIGESTSVNVADAISNEIFDGYERAYTPEEVAERVMKQLVAAPKVEKAPEPKKVKYCVSCLKECDADAKFCSTCAGNQFADTLKEAELMKMIERERIDKENHTQAQTLSPSSKSANLDTLVFEMDQNGYSVRAGDHCEGDVIIPSSYNGLPVVSIKQNAFSRCSGLTSISIPDSVTNIGNYAFNYCRMLATVIIGRGITNIPKCLFIDCINLSNISIPNGIQHIGENAFKNCKKIQVINIPDSVLTIGESAFEDCSNLNTITLGKGLKTISKNMFSGCSSLQNISISKETIKIEDYAFRNCSQLVSFIMPNSVTSIGASAFQRCIKLVDVSLSNNLNLIPHNLFAHCLSLESITIPDSVIKIDEYAFNNCDNLSKINFGKGLNFIGDNAFMHCVSLKNVSIPNNVTYIGNGAFSDCDNLKSITVPFIGTSINTASKKLEDIFYPIHRVGNFKLTYKTTLEKITITGNSSIATWACAGFSGLKSVIIGDGVNSIYDYAFSGCSNLENITIGRNVRTIGQKCFRECNKLSSVVFANPQSWRKAGGGLFSKIPEKILADPQKAAEALKTKYADDTIERK